MTKPREKTREELTAEIEDGKKKIRQFENREKIIKQIHFSETSRETFTDKVVRLIQNDSGDETA